METIHDIILLYITYEEELLYGVIMKEPVFLKESSNAEEQLEKLKALEPLLNPEGKTIIRQDI